MRLTESENLSQLSGKPIYHIDLVDGVLGWCDNIPSEISNTDSSINIEILNTFDKTYTEIAIHYKKFGCSMRLDNFIYGIDDLSTYKHADLEKERSIKMYLAEEFGYYEFVSDSFKVTKANIVTKYKNAYMRRDII